MKIALCHLLLKYDWRLVPGEEIKQSMVFEGNYLFHPQTELQIKRRQEDIDLSVQ